MDNSSYVDLIQVVSQEGTKLAQANRNDNVSLILAATSTLFLWFGRLHAKKSQREQTELLKQLVKESRMVPIIWKGALWFKWEKGRYDTIISQLTLHGMGGTLAGTTSWFNNPFNLLKASAHYGVGQSEIHQYVKPENTAYSDNNWGSNLRTISLELENAGGVITENVLNNAAWLTVTQLIPQYYNNRRPDRSWIKMHREVADKPTACPVGLDIDRFIAMLQALYDQVNATPEQPSLPHPEIRVDASIVGRDYVAKATVNRRVGRGLAWPNVADKPTIQAGEVVQFTGNYSEIDGYKFCELTIGGWVALNSDLFALRVPVAQQVTVTAVLNGKKVGANVRQSPSTTARIVGNLKHGQSFTYLSAETVNGQTWLKISNNQFVFANATNYGN